MIRLDKALVEQGFADTRAKAQDAIKEGRVSVDGKVIIKNSFAIDETAKLEVKTSELSFVSRAGYKLYDVIEPFHLSLANRIVLDVGASTGGFSDVCLQQGAAYVYAVDVGSDQLDMRLRQHPQLCNMEHVNCRYLEKSMFEKPIDFCTIDVSFISLKLILPAVVGVMEHVEIIALVKPQFEAGKKDVGKGGIVKDARIHERILKDMEHFVHSLGLYVHHVAASSICGRDGNKEFIFHIKEEVSTKTFDFKKIIENYQIKR